MQNQNLDQNTVFLLENWRMSSYPLITVAWKGSLLIFRFLNFFVLGKSLVHMKIFFKVFEEKKSILGPKINLRSLGFEPLTILEAFFQT